MSCCNHHRKGKHHRRGIIYRVTNGIAQYFGVKRKLVLAGFIVGLVFQAPLAILVFLAALVLLEHPEKAAPFKQKMSDLFSSTNQKVDRGPAPASASPGGEPNDFDFGDLRQQFAELERRAGHIEQHVTSDEFELNREFNRMKNDKE